MVSRAKNEDTVSVKKLVVFDLDGTLAPSKASIDAEMAALSWHPARCCQIS